TSASGTIRNAAAWMSATKPVPTRPTRTVLMCCSIRGKTGCVPCRPHIIADPRPGSRKKTVQGPCVRHLYGPECRAGGPKFEGEPGSRPRLAADSPQSRRRLAQQVDDHAQPLLAGHLLHARQAEVLLPHGVDQLHVERVAAVDAGAG